ncbi:2',5'-phosphodiesterase 12 [Spea bombifrons]|uniref:2',5'-phosphodiesterase 12 n=1 Tax=Spea bombifrons TaxID=233779 RepID=UPI0023495DE0|nr:2',5'-phosphodiesterase 12 [Spea bombifrons]
MSAVRLLLSRLGGMERAVVRALPSEPKLSISLELAGSLRHLQREQSEPLGRALARIAASATRAPSKKIRRQQQPDPPPCVRLTYRGLAVSDEALNGEAWRDGAVLEVGEARYLVQRNPPSCLQLELPSRLLAGFPLCPAVRLEFARPELCRFVWYREVLGMPGVEEPGQPQAPADPYEDQAPVEAGDCPEPPAGAGWEEAGRGQLFTPSASDVGLRLKLRCTPGDGQRFGPSRELEAGSPVEAGPGSCTFERRHTFTQHETRDPVLRTASYNVLADVYAQSPTGRTVLFAYCPAHALERDYRQSLLRRELAGYRADVICLQEVDGSVYQESLGPALAAGGMDGVYRGKERQREGLATFFRRSRFSLVGQHDIRLSQALLEDPLHAELLAKLQPYPDARDSVVQRSTALQVSVLQSRSDPSQKICVANTHLYFHPKGGNIRLVQIAVALAHIRRVAYELYPGIPIIFCGDFNSTPTMGMYSFVKNGTIDESHEDWTSNGEEERCNMSLSHPLKLESACGEPEYTNYVVGFNGCLDYIFIDAQRVEVERVIPLPTHEEVTRHRALPSVSHPSDHLALVCDLRLKQIP